jgi:hypothetical protein
MRYLFFTFIILCIFCVQLASADETDTGNWTLDGSHTITKGGSFTVSGYTVTLSDINYRASNSNNYTLLVTISKGSVTGTEIMEVGDAIYFDEDTIQIDYTSSSDTGQTFSAWVAKSPAITLTTSTIRWDSAPHYKCDLTFHNGGTEADEFTAKLITPTNCTVNVSTIIDSVKLITGTDQTKTVYFSCKEPLPSRDVVVNIKYTFMGGKKSAILNKVITLPTPDTAIIATVTAPDASPAQVQSAVNSSTGTQLNIIPASTTQTITQPTVQSTPVAQPTTTQVVTSPTTTQTTVTQSVTTGQPIVTTTTPSTTGATITSEPLPAIPQPPKTVDFRKVLAEKKASEQKAVDDQVAAQQAEANKSIFSKNIETGVVQNNSLNTVVSDYQFSKDQKGAAVIVSMILCWLFIIRL